MRISTLTCFAHADVETVQTQVAPYLESIGTRGELESHLQGLVGGGAERTAFVRQYVDGRFPQALPKPSAPQNPSTVVGQGRGRGAGPSRAPPSLDSSPRTVEPTTNDLATLSATFGSGGSLYVKNRDEALFSGTGGKKGKGHATRGSGSAPNSAPGTGTHTPASSRSGRASPAQAPALAPPVAASMLRQPSPTQLQEPRATSPALAPVTIPLTATAAETLSRLDSVLTGLSAAPSKSRTPTNAIPCHCATRLHQPPLAPLPSICTRCALVLCHLTPPLGPCPSCTHYPLMDPGFAETVRAHFETERTSLVEREKRMAAEKAKREKEEAQKERFPELGGRGSPSHSTRGYATSAGGGPSLDTRIAQGYARMEAEGKARAQAAAAEVARKSQPRTVLRLTKDGKAKLVTTTPVASPSPGNGDAGADSKATKPLQGWIDENDDGWRRQQGQQPLVSAPTKASTPDHQRGGVPGDPSRQLKYVPPKTYETENAAE